ncbi:B3 domain-containing protein Os07g0563300-like isoform X2 [Magnolia sinica]|uniref:B3 domain-containing protein Os07g0563300-like isoform X2 n=1 Tax=Magnolia sinica TaxID=86752 RepID=UPI00265903D0|nr:B3 domain-containing protein Os07g0563300-like isoform X2 [Magnolia sinica]
MSSSSSSSKICFNPDCKEAKSDPSRKGWRLRVGDFAELCDRCGSAYEEVRFCETFHSDAAGWRNCESCGKKVHCGCIASVHAFILLDAGGIECMACARKPYIAASNQIWPPSLFPPPPLPDRLKDLSVKSRNQMTGPSSVPGQWWQATNLWNTAHSQSELRPRMPCDVDRPNNVDKLISSERPSPSAQEKKVKDSYERIPSTGLKLAALDSLLNGNVSADALTAFSTFRKEERKVDGLPDDIHITVDDPADTKKRVIAAEPGLTSSVAGMNFETHSSSCVNISLSSSKLKDEPSTPLFGLGVSLSSPNETNDPAKVSGTLSQRQTPPPPPAKQFFANSQNGGDSSGELQTHIRNGRPRGEGQRRTHLLPRYWPRITDQELQQISGDSNSVITPLFEKMLSASDAGRIGRLVLPKKCAEAYFPTISQPEGLPLKVQDARGKDWVFQFRFWPNNNSRMYVLEGVTPCIQSMQLQAGDTVTFSRIDPEGKLVMGFRKASNVPSEQALKTGNGFSTSGENNKNAKPSEAGSAFPLRPYKGGADSAIHSSINQINLTDPAYPWSKFDKTGYIQKEGTGAKSSLLPSKRKSSTLGSKSKRLRINNEDSMELKMTWEQTQELLRPPPNYVPTIVVIEGHEFEEYEEAPVLGKPTIFTTNPAGETNQWAQCEDCSKWRKLPLDALLPARWTCSGNLMDPKRSSCSAAQEITTEQLEDLLPPTGRSKRSKTKEETDAVEAAEGLDTLANLAILGEGEALPPSAQPTTKHPRHRPGCTCIVCIQPPSGKGPKHKQTCTCNVCLTVKRRFRTLMLRREKRQSEKEAERKKQQFQSTEKPEQEDELAGNKSNGSPSQKTAANGDDEDPNRWKSSCSPFKGRIDLNIQPEREEEPSPVSDSGGMMQLLRDATEQCLKQQRLGTPVGNGEPVINQVEPSSGTGGERPSVGPHNSGHPDADKDRPVSISMTVSASTSATG